MSIDRPFQGGLFAGDFLGESIVESDGWQAFDDGSLDGLEAALRGIFDRFPTAGSPNESQTEDDLIWPVLRELGWAASLRQQNLSVHGHQNVPDGLLFADEAAKDRANGFVHEWRRYELGLAIVESNDGFARSTAGPGSMARKRHPRPRCCAISAGWTTSRRDGSAGGF